MDALEIQPRRIYAKEVFAQEASTPQRRGHVHIPSFRDALQTKEQLVGSEDLSGESKGEKEEPQLTESKDAAEARKDIWSMDGDFIYRHHIEPRVQLHVPKEESDATRATRKNLDVLQEKT